MFEQLTNEQKETLLKTLVLFAVQSNVKVELLDSFAKFAAQGFDQMIVTKIDGDTITFERKDNK
jgi:uncharacterized protein YeaC (DUF1315 family)